MQRRPFMIAGLASAALRTPALAQPPLRDIAIPISSFSFVSAGLRLANALGLFAKNGLNLKIIVMDSANAAAGALISGSAEIIMAGAGEQIAARSRGQPIVLVTDIYSGLGASLVLSKSAAARTGIDPAAPPAQRIKALDGLIIASPSATSSYTVAFKGAAEALGAKMRFTYMAQPAMLPALETGAIQGMIAGAPFWGFPVTKGAGLLWLSGPRRDLPDNNLPISSGSLQAMQPFAEANPRVMQQIIAAIRELGAIITTNPATVKAALAKLYPDVDAPTLDVLFESEAPLWNTRPLTPADMAHEIEFVRSGNPALQGLDRINPATLLYKAP